MLQIRFHISATDCPRYGGDDRTSVVWHRPDSRPLGYREEPMNGMRPIRMAIHVSQQTNTDLNLHDADNPKDAYRTLDMD